jgi:hypothetical protein
MDFGMSHAEDPERALDELLLAWPTGLEDQEQWAKLVGTAPTKGPFQRGGRVARPNANEAAFLVYDRAFPSDYPTFRAVLRRTDGGWNLCSLKAQCPACLGEGTLPFEGTICKACGGDGWGIPGFPSKADLEPPTRQDRPKAPPATRPLTPSGGRRSGSRGGPRP